MEDGGDPVAAVHVIGGKKARRANNIGDEVGVELKIDDVDGDVVWV